MKVFITVDMEGVAGVVHQEHTARDGREHDRARMLMTEEANAAICGALEAGADEIIVNDSHGTMRNIIPESLRKEAKLILGSPKMYGMMEGLDNSYDAAIYIGYHTMSGTDGILNHTYNSRKVSRILVNGSPMGEFGINALLAGHYQVPSVFVSGCHLTVAEAKSHVPNIYHAEVKETINRTVAKNLHPEVSRELIEKGVKKGLTHKDTIQPLQLDDQNNMNIEISFLNTALADVVESLPMVNRVDPLTIGYTASNMAEGYRMIRSMLSMA